MIIESIKIAFSSLLHNKMRSVLTMLGLIVGIGSVIAILALGQGGRQSIIGQFDTMGASSIMLSVDSSKSEQADYFTLGDIEAIKKLSGVEYVSPRVVTLGNVSINSKTNPSFIIGFNEDSKYFTNLNIKKGRIFTNIDQNSQVPKVILEKNSAIELFGTDNIIGKKIDIRYGSKKMSANIVGIADSSSASFSSMARTSSNETPAVVYLTFRHALELKGNDLKINILGVKTSNPNINDYVGNSVINLVQKRHSNSQREVYSFQKVSDILKQIDSILGLITSFIIAVAGISLIVGGVGVMNIMLVSVTERTREIGIRKALGATKYDILMQFLTESIILTLVGGIIGILFGWTIAIIIGKIADFSPIITPDSIILAVAFSTAVGLFFGIYPSNKAAKLNPIDALRYE